MHIKLWQEYCNVLITKNITPWQGFEPGIFCSVGWRDDHYATPPGQVVKTLPPGEIRTHDLLFLRAADDWLTVLLSVSLQIVQSA
jgi:hypothetical protein